MRRSERNLKETPPELEPQEAISMESVEILVCSTSCMLASSCDTNVCSSRKVMIAVFGGVKCTVYLQLIGSQPSETQAVSWTVRFAHPLF